MTLNIGVLAIQGDVTENFLSVMASLNELGMKFFPTNSSPLITKLGVD